MQRFWDKVAVWPPTDCWIWQFSKDPGGYGTFQVSTRAWKAHRFAWTLMHGPIPHGIKVLHRCDNPPCVNPQHLFLGTQADNVRDMVAKGRSNFIKTQYGEKNPASRLTADKVLQMRAIPRTISYKTIGKMYGISTMTAFRAITGQSWSHL